MEEYLVVEDVRHERKVFQIEQLWLCCDLIDTRVPNVNCQVVVRLPSKINLRLDDNGMRSVVLCFSDVEYLDILRRQFICDVGGVHVLLELRAFVEIDEERRYSDADIRAIADHNLSLNRLPGDVVDYNGHDSAEVLDVFGLHNEFAGATVDHDDGRMAILGGLCQLLAIKVRRLKFFAAILVADRVMHTASDCRAVVDLAEVAH